MFSSTLTTNVDGIQIGQLLPQLAQQADKYSIIRGMTHGNNGHETAAYMVQTGRPSGGREVLLRCLLTFLLLGLATGVTSTGRGGKGEIFFEVYADSWLTPTA